jgi:hypothetical protein
MRAITPHEEKAVEEAPRFAREIGLKGRLKLLPRVTGDSFTECGMEIFRAGQLLLENVRVFEDLQGRPVRVQTRIEVGDGKGKPPKIFAHSMIGAGLNSRWFSNKLLCEITGPMEKKARQYLQKAVRARK